VPQKYRHPVMLVLAAAVLMQGGKQPWQVAILVLLWCLVVLCNRRGAGMLRPVTAQPYLYGAAGLMLAWCALSAVRGADCARSLEAIYPWVLFFLCLFSLTVSNTKDTIGYIFSGIAALAMVNAVALLVASAVWHRSPYGLLPLNPNYAGFLISFGLAVALFRMVDACGMTRARAAAWAWAGSALLFVWALAVINSRAAYLSVGWFCAVLAYRRWGARGGLLVALAICAIAAIAPVSLTKLAEPFSYGRGLIWLTALRALAARPFTGFGPGNFGLAYDQWKFPDPLYPIRFSHVSDYAHNDFLQIGVELGLPCMVVVCWLFVRLMRSGFVMVGSAGSIHGRTEGAITLCMLGAAGIQMTVNFVIHHPALLVLTAVPVAHLCACGARPAVRANPRRWGGAALAVMMLPVLLMVAANAAARAGRPALATRLFPIDAGHWRALYERSVHSGTGYRAALPFIRRAAALSPLDAGMVRQEAGCLYRAAKDCTDAEERQCLLTEAEAILFRAAGIFQSDCFTPQLLGKIYFNEGRDMDALRMFGEALRREPLYWEARFLSARALMRLGRTHEALRVLDDLALLRARWRDVQPRSGYERTLLAYDQRAYERLRHVCADSG